jgi:predicted acylesterase/phospholipase RssA
LPVEPALRVSHIETIAGPLEIRDHYYPGQGVLREAVVPGPTVMAGPSTRPDGSVGYDLCALSGGGSNGAFGAGVLCGWTQAGTRPTFQVVTGISTGSLVASFAFAGPRFDPALQSAFTTVDDSRIFRRHLIASWPWSDSLCDTTPLANLIAQYADAELLRAIAEGHRQGRRLYVGTTNLDQKRLIMWDMGSIAACGHPGAADLYHRVLRASCSIPVMFNPVEFRVLANGERRSEMHVDGGARTSVFMRRALVGDFEVTAADPDVRRSRAVIGAEERPDEPAIPILEGSRLYIIVNGKLRPDPEPAARGLVPIAGGSMEALMSASFNGDMARMFLFCLGTGAKFQLIAVPRDMNAIPSAKFDPYGMHLLFQAGYQMAQAGDAWQRAPRGLEDSEIRQLEDRLAPRNQPRAPGPLSNDDPPEPAPATASRRRNDGPDPDVQAAGWRARRDPTRPSLHHDDQILRARAEAEDISP